MLHTGPNPQLFQTGPLMLQPTFSLASEVPSFMGGALAQGRKGRG